MNQPVPRPPVPPAPQGKRNIIAPLMLGCGVLLLAGAGIGIALQGMTTSAGAPAGGGGSLSVIARVNEAIDERFRGPATQAEAAVSRLPSPAEGWEKIDATTEEAAEALREALLTVIRGDSSAMPAGVTADAFRALIEAAPTGPDPVRVADASGGGLPQGSTVYGSVYVSDSEAVMILIERSTVTHRSLGQQIKGIAHAGIVTRKFGGKSFQVYPQTRGLAVRMKARLDNGVEVTLLGYATDATLNDLAKRAKFNAL